LRFTQTIATPIGACCVEATNEAIISISFSEHPVVDNPNRLSALGAAQLAEYFAGVRHIFELPLMPVGTDFQRSVWQLLAELPFGKTVSYTELSVRFGNPKAIRALAAAIAKNPLAIVVPCHRVLGSDGSLTGYAWGLEKKRWLLTHEGALPETLF
jgi:methylated-DNA-[protein]-cysteine S-methyltransferase